MGRKVLTIDGRREGYAIDQIDYTMTVGELIRHLSFFNEDMPVMLNNDNGYTYGSITESSFEVEEDDSDDYDEEDDEDEDLD